MLLKAGSWLQKKIAACKRFGAWLARTLGWVPVLNCLLAFPISTHKLAIPKFLFLFILSSLPLLFSTLLGEVPAGTSSIETAFAGELLKSPSTSDLFIYTATFLTPIFYLIFERYRALSEKDREDNIGKNVTRIFRGYGLVATMAILLLLVTAIAFGPSKTGMASPILNTFLSHLLVKYSWCIYLFSLYCWYLTILDSVIEGSYVDDMRDQETESVNSFQRRLADRALRNSND